ncbi:hypothetical protein Micbo1qcDRAFT_201687 [Microdochium bolleyi]|uniref:RRM domain-containing protein n=1 Tax=Microdochium bolleyi TaxID=196109 RepID=A0A136J994_9PEZI|nr:hypothetical protein Micbo1qcDRAFT_201687 [Microdochium bolleyi]
MDNLMFPAGIQPTSSVPQSVYLPAARVSAQGHHTGFPNYLQPQMAYQRVSHSPTTGLTQVNFTHGQAVTQGPTFTPMEGLRKQQDEQESPSSLTKNNGTTNEVEQKKYEALRRNQLEVTGMSANYKGDPWLSGNRSAEISDDDNTALWITNLPPDIDYPTLLGAIRDCGKIYACVINYPVEGKHNTAACKLVFFDTIGAKRLLGQSRAGVFRVPNSDRSEYYKPRVGHNRIKSRAREANALADVKNGSVQPNQSRCLSITGPPALVNEQYLTRFFKSKFEFQLEKVATL